MSTGWVYHHSIGKHLTVQLQLFFIMWGETKKHYPGTNCIFRKKSFCHKGPTLLLPHVVKFQLVSNFPEPRFAYPGAHEDFLS